MKNNKKFNKAKVFNPSKVSGITNEFAEVAPISNGNLYINKISTEISRELAGNQMRTNSKEITGSLKEYFKSRTIIPYLLLQQQADYFCNTINFGVENIVLGEMILKIIRNAFINGRSALHVDLELNKTYAVNIVDLKHNMYGELVEVTWSPIDATLESESKPDFGKNGITTKTVKGLEKCKNFVVFKWGIMAYSAWIIIWPFIQQQADFLKMISAQMFSHTKKFVYNVDDPSAISNEMELFFDPDNIFLIETGFGNAKNSITQMDVGGKSDGLEIINYYNELIKIYYSLYGRRVNNEKKEQTNLTDEVEASQEQYDTIQKNWINQFKLFAYGVNLLIPNSITIKEYEEKKAEKDALTNNQGEKDNESN